MKQDTLLPLHGFWWKVASIEGNGTKLTLERREATSKSIKRTAATIKRLTKSGARVKL